MTFTRTLLALRLFGMSRRPWSNTCGPSTYRSATRRCRQCPTTTFLPCSRSMNFRRPGHNASACCGRERGRECDGRHADPSRASKECYYPGRKADHDPCRLARQVNEFCERAARTVNQRLDPCQLVRQVNESGSENGVSREDSFTCRTSRQGSSLASRVSHLANKTTSPAGQARRGRVSKLLAEVIRTTIPRCSRH